MMITNKFKLDLQNPGAVPTINAVQNDSGSRNLEITLFSGRQPFAFPETGRVVLWHTFPAKSIEKCSSLNIPHYLKYLKF